MTGLLLLIAGAEVLVRGASRLAAIAGLSPLVIGLTIVAFGTSSPEFSVSLKSVFSNQAEVAAGNVIGSNIFNILFILGLSSLITPLNVKEKLVRFDVPVMIVLSVVVWIFSVNLIIGQMEGLLMFSTLLIYITLLIYFGRSTKEDRSEGASINTDSDFSILQVGKHLVFVAIGLVMLIYGSGWFVDGAIEAARFFGVSELVIGLTIVAAGTSLPEVFTSVIAAFRGERDIAVGNVVGSNIFNLLGVLGFTAFMSPGGLGMSSSLLSFDLPVMVFVSLLCLPIFLTGKIINRREGAFLLFLYVAYMTTLWGLLKTTRFHLC
ncbi:calcium/sodium antiporter [Rhodohalobacter halophilus]|uniref:calcium/sodium antiporter n=1 Tax=Rhodohalobacter halophilus TaxID=1812810 RepID=UPI00083F7667|nr:calcium/sodium antiporter [Rhodohalobacter halophilus]